MTMFYHIWLLFLNVIVVKTCRFIYSRRFLVFFSLAIEHPEGKDFFEGVREFCLL